MNELTMLQALRDDVSEPTPEQLAPAFGRLEQAMHAPARRRRRVPRARWVLVGAAGATALTLVGGNAAMAAQSTHAASVLGTIANETINFVDPDPGEYLRSRTHADWLIETARADGTVDREMNEQVLDVYKPSDTDAEWVLRRDWRAQEDVPGDEETLRAEDGDFYGGSPSEAADLSDIPETGPGALAYFDAQYSGGNKSRDEDNFDRIVAVLRTGLVPAQLRAALFEALALIPGVTSTSDVANLDGKQGIAIGRTEVLRGGQRQEIILDPETGLVIGERDLFTVAAFGFGVNEVIGLTAIETSVVESAP